MALKGESERAITLKRFLRISPAWSELYCPNPRTQRGKNGPGENDGGTHSLLNEGHSPLDFRTHSEDAASIKAERFKMET
jgi:hypothetical protein